MKYQITSYQLIHSSGARDTVKPLTPVTVTNIEEYRKKLRERHNYAVVNLSYTEIPIDMEEIKRV